MDIMWLDKIDSNDTAKVGGKNSSLGEMIQKLKKEEIRVPGGFATTADAYGKFLEHNGIETKIKERIEDMKEGESLDRTGRSIRRLFKNSEFPDDLKGNIEKAYRQLAEKYETKETDVAVRSSATAEDLPEASFAGQQ
jgi:pyruvate,water dikinase